MTVALDTRTRPARAPLRVVVTGNAGAGKSTLATRLSAATGAVHLDLDSLAWTEADPPCRRDLRESLAAIDAFVMAHDAWVVEGCYTELLEPVARCCTCFVYLNPGIEACVRNCEARPWEPHKYSSPAAQHAMLPALLAWVRDYESRDDTFSRASHRALFDACQACKIEVTASLPPADLIDRITCPEGCGMPPTSSGEP